MFVIRKNVVLDALKWLKEYNIEYSNIEIKESNLNWIEDGIAQELPANMIKTDDEKFGMNLPGTVDMGPSETQTMSGLQNGSNNTDEVDSVMGILPSVIPHIPKEKDKEVIDSINIKFQNCFESLID